MKHLRKLIIAAFGLTLLALANAQAASQITFYHHDALGSVIATSNQNGYLELNEEYQPYGEKIYQTEDANSGNEDWYTGKNYSEELDLTYFGARWYDAKQGRFLSIDPAPVRLASIHSFNRYHYANSNPYKYVDPDGNTACETNTCRINEAKKVITNNPLKGAKMTKGNSAIGQGSGGFNSRSGGAHDGVDLKADVGTTIEAAGNGRAYVGPATGYGLTVKIDHGNGIETRYAHVSEYGVGNRASVKAGAGIAKVGITGNLPEGGESHLHFEIMVDGNFINPEKVFDLEQDE